jgi:hypothetical protein
MLFVWDENSILGMNVLRTDAVLAIVQGETKGVIRRGSSASGRLAQVRAVERTEGSGSRGRLAAGAAIKGSGQVDLIAVV